MSPARPVVGEWLIERGEDARFPYRLQIRSASGAAILAVRAQDRWPAANRNIFCLREREAPAPDASLTEVERVDIVAMQRRGPRLSVVLDRPRYKRCDFLIVNRERKDGSGQVEQIYWQTQTSMSQRRPTVSPGVLNRRSAYIVKIAAEERYPWTFPGSEVSRGLLPAGDYALVRDGHPYAVVERKTFENLLHDFGVLPVLHQRLLELSGYEQNALVVEAPYEDFLNPAKVHHFSATYCAAAIAELYAKFPRLRVVFCSNRKTANLWTRNYFAAVAAGWQDEQTPGDEAG